MAISFMKTVMEAGVSVPEDLSVVGFDGIEFAEFVTPTLTTIQQPRHEIGRTGARVLHRGPGNGTPPAQRQARCAAHRPRQHRAAALRVEDREGAANSEADACQPDGMPASCAARNTISLRSRHNSETDRELRAAATQRNHDHDARTRQPGAPQELQPTGIRATALSEALPSAAGRSGRTNLVLADLDDHDARRTSASTRARSGARARASSTGSCRPSSGTARLVFIGR